LSGNVNAMVLFKGIRYVKHQAHVVFNAILHLNVMVVLLLPKNL